MVKQSYRSKKLWGTIIPTLEVENEIPFHYLHNLNMFLSDGNVVSVKTKLQFEKVIKEKAEENIHLKRLNFQIDYSRLIGKVERIFNKSTV